VTEAPPVRVLLAAAQPLMLGALRQVIDTSDGVLVVGEASAATVALALLDDLRAEIVLAVHSPPAVDAVLLAAELLRRERPARLIVVGPDHDLKSARRALRAGAAGWVSDGVNGETLAAAVIACASGGTLVPPELVREIPAGGEVRARPASVNSILSPREREVLQLLSRDKRPSRIASELFVSTATVRTHLVRIYGKLLVSSAAAAVAEALRQGIID
jgi:DNA-binding NarL/FixJ family response regulator